MQDILLGFKKEVVPTSVPFEQNTKSMLVVLREFINHDPSSSKPQVTFKTLLT